MSQEVGRPTKYKPEYCEILVEHLSSGLFYQSFAGIVNVSIDTLYEWEKVHPAFSEAKKIGTAKAHLFWDRFGHDTLTSGNKCDTAMYIHRMGNQFKWRRNDDPIAIKVEDSKKEELIIIRPSDESTPVDGN